jgi:hypothetical protein
MARAHSSSGQSRYGSGTHVCIPSDTVSRAGHRQTTSQPASQPGYCPRTSATSASPASPSPPHRAQQACQRHRPCPLCNPHLPCPRPRSQSCCIVCSTCCHRAACCWRWRWPWLFWCTRTGQAALPAPPESQAHAAAAPTSEPIMMMRYSRRNRVNMQLLSSSGCCTDPMQATDACHTPKSQVLQQDSPCLVLHRHPRWHSIHSSRLLHFPPARCCTSSLQAFWQLCGLHSPL